MPKPKPTDPTNAEVETIAQRPISNRHGLPLELGRLLSGQATTADVIGGLVQVGAAIGALKRTGDALRSDLERRAWEHRRREGTKWRAPVAGIANAYLPEGDPELEVTDHGALADWLEAEAVHEQTDPSDAIVHTRVVRVLDAGNAHDALEALTQADVSDPDLAIDSLLDAVSKLTLAVEWYVDRTVDVAVLCQLYPLTDDDGYPVTPDGERVPHLRWTEPEPGAITVKPETAHRQRLTRAYALRLGLPEELL